ncbi:hypothetical protein FJU30_18215 [Affinibrenneria salicis]|uniref:Uncharacterized protein n=1 Tax=Affinibrenneria salicis TaxID=2590031 RepID=A0A5J5FW36_9GAMM|nr:hypothetical protein FJU30_18215 [Affinibrenneria salicis]
MRCKYIVFIFAIVSVSFNVLFLYNWIDRSVSLSYSKKSFDDCNNDLSITKIIIKDELKGKDKNFVLQRIRKNKLDSYSLIKDNVLYLGNTELIF